MFQLSSGDLTLLCAHDSLPSLYAEYRSHAKLSDEFALTSSEGQVSFLAVRRADDWPFLVLAQRYSPTPASGFFPGALLVPESGLLFVGAGERLLCYDLTAIKRIWEDTTNTGFWSWSRHHDTVLMSAELELAAWDCHGRKLWSTFVEPPWQFEVRAQLVHLDVMGVLSSFDLHHGPPAIERIA